tara:strand:+ start:27172 stop:27396 length:225 start_codon:yes stop_codon:yes gene_type:complete
MISELHDEAHLIADCRNDDVIVAAHALAERTKESRVLQEMVKLHQEIKTQNAADENGGVNMIINTDEYAYAIIG